MERNVIKWVLRVFFVMGLLFMVVAAYQTHNTLNFMASAQKATGVVVGFDSYRSTTKGRTSIMYRPQVRFNGPDNQPISFIDATASSPAAYNVGDAVEVLYAPAQAQSAKINSFASLWMLPAIFGLLGLILTAVASGITLHRLKRLRQIKWLQEYGTKISAILNPVRPIAINGVCCWQLTCEWTNPKNGRRQTFKSDLLWFDPTPYVADTIDVRIDPQNSKKYWVDTARIHMACKAA